MKCCVPYCSSNSKHAAKSKGITYHMFPNQKSHRKTWLQAIGMIDSEVKDHSMICSKHFLPKDIYDTSGGQRRIRNGAVPIKFKESIDDDDKGANLMVCRICLAINCILYPMSICNLGQAFQHITGLTVTAEDGLPQQVCTECATRLSNCYKFREKSLKANTIMLEILKGQEYLSIADIKSVDRENNFLASNLIIKNYEVDYADFNVTYEEKTEARDIDVKSEVDEIYFTENDDVNNDNHDINHQNDSDDDFKNSDADNDENDADLDFSSDDSIPLEKQRKKKKRVEKKTVKVRKKQPKKVQSEPKIDRRRKPFLNDDLNETLFTITDLTYDEQVGEIEKRRESANYKNSSFKCQECFKGFLDEHAYSTHMSRHTNECGEHECGICKTHFKHPHALRKHITAHHSQRFSCNQCSYVTTHRQTARLHERWHKGTKYQCPHCQEEFVKFTTYMGHIRIKHPSDFVCELCGYSFVSAKGIELHKKLKHRLEDAQIPDDGPFCELCNVRFVSQEAYRRHLSVSGRHSDKIDPKGKRPKERKEKKREIDDKRLCRNQLRRAEGPIPCEQCGLQLEDSRAYHGHFRRMHPDKNRTNYPSMKTPCMCEVCGRMFQSYALLKDHTWVHTGERPFKCDSCDKSFRMKQRLVAHRRVHSQVKRTYVCNVCGKHFSTHSNRQRHMFIHTGLKPFKCEMCGKGFKHSSEKRAHITYVHLKKPWPKRTRGKRRLDGRPGQIQPPSLPTSGSEMDVQPIWPPCDPKLNEINSIIDDKPMYYNLKQVI